MKTILTSIFDVAIYFGSMAQTVTPSPSVAATKTVALLPDQNPNFQKSRDKYMADSDKYTANEGTTVQETYKAIDDVEIKKEQKQLRKDRRQERRMARIQSRGRSNYYNNGYYNRGYYNNGAYNGYYNPNGISSPQYYSNNLYTGVNSILNTAFLGLAIWSILKH